MYFYSTFCTARSLISEKYTKNDFAEVFKFLLDTNLKIILLKTLKIMSNVAKSFDFSS